MTVFVN